MGAGVADSRAHTDWAHTALALLDVAAVEKEMGDLWRHFLAQDSGN